MERFILHSYRRCPFCIRTRIVFELKGIPYEVVEEPLRKWTPWMRAWSDMHDEKARVPVLQYVLEEGVETTMAESNEINLFLDAYAGVPELTPAAGSPGYEAMEEWWVWCGDVFKPTIDLYKYGENLQFDAEKNQEHELTLRGCMDYLEKALVSEGHLVEGRRTLADIAIIPFVRQVMRTRGGVFDMTPYPHTLAWTKDIIETPWFTERVMQKYPLADTELGSA